MVKFLSSLCLVAFWNFSPAMAQSRAPRYHRVELNGQTFTLPVGFEIELIAAPPLVDRPIHADFDENGNLYVADSSGSNEPVQQQLLKKPHRILRLQDTQGSGKFDKRTIFADKMMFPEGAMWNNGSLYVAAPPSIWKLTDTTGTGVADKREEWFKGQTLTNCANDLHGPYAGPDGWIYWCKGAFAKQTYERPGKEPFVSRAAHIFRCRPDGTGLEAVMNGGMDNPVEVAFTPGGDRIFTTTFFQHPGGGNRDGLVHAIYGGVYGKNHDAILGHPRTSPELMPVLTHLGPAAPAGLMRYESDVFGEEYPHNLFAAQFNMHKISRHILEQNGSTFKTTDYDFLISDNFDFHPTDVLEDADGSLLVIDTGGWYKLCCPTSQLAKPDITGGIYRIRKSDAKKVEDPRGLKLNWKDPTESELAKRLEDPRPSVRKRTVELLATWGEKAIPVLELVQKQKFTAIARLNCVWVAARLASPESKAYIQTTLNDADATVRQAALNSISLLKDSNAIVALKKIVSETNSSPIERRIASEALGRIGDATSVPVLLKQLALPADRVLEHALTFAMIEIGDVVSVAGGLQDPNPKVRRAALIALDQMPGKKLAVESWKNLLQVNENELKPEEKAVTSKILWWVASHHPEWADALAEVVKAQLQKGSMDVETLAGFAADPKIQSVLAETLKSPSVPAQALALKVLAAARLKQTPDLWTEALVALVEKPSASHQEFVFETIRSLKLSAAQAPRVSKSLALFASDTAKPAKIRIAALASIPVGGLELDAATFQFARQYLPDSVEVFRKAKLSSAQLIELTNDLKKAEPLQINRLVEAFDKSSDPQVGVALVQALKSAMARSSLQIDTLKSLFKKFGPTLAKEEMELYALIDTELLKQQAKLEEMITKMKKGDIRKGQLIFNSQKAACITCHTMGYLGGNVGPELTNIGRIRTERDLLESIVFPSASIVRSYESVKVTTSSGQTYIGILKRENAQEVVLIQGAVGETRIARTDIEEMQPSKVSIMPAGLDQQMTLEELADLVAFLKSSK